MKLTTIYTKTGDRGLTSLVGGIRVSKDSVRIEAYGTIDELSSHIGLLNSLIQKERSILPSEHSDVITQIQARNEQIQNTLFNVSTYLATDITQTAVPSSAKISHDVIDVLEHDIDTINASLPTLNSFILPGGNILASQCHVCRTVCRRAERRIVSLASSLPEDNTEKFNMDIIRYINRLSDYLFVLSRKLNFLYNTEEKIWKNSCK